MLKSNLDMIVPAELVEIILSSTFVLFRWNETADHGHTSNHGSLFFANTGRGIRLNPEAIEAPTLLRSPKI